MFVGGAWNNQQQKGAKFQAKGPTGRLPPETQIFLPLYLTGVCLPLRILLVCPHPVRCLSLPCLPKVHVCPPHPPCLKFDLAVPSCLSLLRLCLSPSFLKSTVWLNPQELGCVVLRTKRRVGRHLEIDRVTYILVCVSSVRRPLTQTLQYFHVFLAENCSLQSCVQRLWLLWRL